MIRGRLTAARGSRISCVATTAAGRYELPLSLTVVEETTFDFRHLNRCNGCFVPRLVSVDKESFVPSLPRALSLPINSLCNSSRSGERERRTELTIACYDDGIIRSRILGYHCNRSDHCNYDAIMRRARKNLSKKISFFLVCCYFRIWEKDIWLEF